MVEFSDLSMGHEFLEKIEVLPSLFPIHATLLEVIDRSDTHGGTDGMVGVSESNVSESLDVVSKVQLVVDNGGIGRWIQLAREGMFKIGAAAGALRILNKMADVLGQKRGGARAVCIETSYDPIVQLPHLTEPMGGLIHPNFSC